MAKLLKSIGEFKSTLQRDIFYHGTLDIYKNSLEESISLSHSLDKKDFGRGFYLTSNYDLAKKTAERKSRRYNRRKNTNKSEPIVLEYIIREEYNENDCNILYFDKQDEEWFGFICSNKNPERQVSEFFPNTWTGNYSIIYGPLADSVLGYYESIEMFEEKQGTKKELLITISEGYEFPRVDQIVIKDEVLANKILEVLDQRE